MEARKFFQKLFGKAEELTPEEHGKLNKQAENFPGGIEAKRNYIKELREKYRKSFKALSNIDLYDEAPNEQSENLKKYRDALQNSGEKEALPYLFDEALRRRFGPSTFTPLPSSKKTLFSLFRRDKQPKKPR